MKTYSENHEKCLKFLIDRPDYCLVHWGICTFCNVKKEHEKAWKPISIRAQLPQPLWSDIPMRGVPNRFKFKVVSAVLVHTWVHGNLHDPKNKHGCFDRRNGQYLNNRSSTINIPESRQTDVFEYFALG